MKKITTADRVRVIAALVEGNSIRSTVRMTGIAKNTVVKLLADVGRVCAEYQDLAMRGLKLDKIQCDEIWSFCHAKQKNVPDEFQGVYGHGDVWTWTAIDANTKLIPCWHVGLRTEHDAHAFMDSLSNRIDGRPQVTTDGLAFYINAIAITFGANVDYARLLKSYGKTMDSSPSSRYSPSDCTSVRKVRVTGSPAFEHVSTSYVERANLTMRMSMRRFTRLTNAFSKKIENHESAIALHFMYYNFCRIHQTLRVTPAMAAGVSDHVWEIADVVELLVAEENRAIAAGSMKRGKYQKKNSN